LNEEANLATTIDSIRHSSSKYFKDYEIIILNDGSTDQTGQIADKLASQDPRIRVIHHASPRNLGRCYAEGVEQSRHHFVIMIPGDNECGVEVMDTVFQLAGKADMIIPFTSNPEVRPLSRQLLSRAFVWLLNVTSGCRLTYYNGAVLHRTSLVKKFGIRTDGFGYQADLLVRMLRAGHSYREVGTKITYRPKGKSKAFRLNNLIKVSSFIGQTLLERHSKPT
jgi:glycosyltransferase involved in cell wall biosynthesis